MSLLRVKLASAAIALASVLAVPKAAPAQEAPPSPSALVEEVEVIARLPGPALWRVSTPTSQLWILGMAGSSPKDWDDRRVAVALDGARELVLPPVATAGLGDVFSILVDPHHILHLPSGQTLRGDLPPALTAQWETAARSIGRDPARYDHWRPVIAALLLTADGANHYRLGLGNPMARLMALAKARRVKPHPLASYKVADLIRGLAATPGEGAKDCIALTAETVQRLPVDGPRRAAAWASGDIKTLRAIGETAVLRACLDAVPAATALRDRAAADWARELDQALATPGKTVVAIDLENLTRKGGLLDQLKAQGLDVIGPEYR